MPQRMYDSTVSRHGLLPDKAGFAAKADVRNADEAWKTAIGKAIEAAADDLGWSLKELAAKVDRDERQVSRWLTGEQRPQFDALFAVVELREPLVIAIAKLAGEAVEIQTVITVRRRA